MKSDEIKVKVLKILGNIAPEADLQSIKADENLRDQLDLDSMDYLNFVIALDEEFKANIPDSDFTKFITVDACVEQLESCLSRAGRI